MSAATARSLFIGSVVLYAAVVVTAGFLLPDQVPLHFDGSGEPDRVGSRLEAIAAFGALGAVLAIVFGAIAAWAPRLPLTYVNMPAASKDWWTATPEREARMRERLARDSSTLGAATMLLLVSVCVATVRAARSSQPALDGWFWASLAVYLLFVVAWSVRVVRGNRPET